MFELYNLGISEETIKVMLEMAPEIKDLSENEIIEKKIILENIGCSNNQIINIVGSNPMFLNRTNSDIIELIKTLLEFKFDTLNILFDSNPYILNLEPYEIKNYINNKINNGEILEDIIDELDSNPYLFNEM
jgi:hypothetical protein